eukprot:5757998-Amphidinium_carterae.2
MQTQVVLGNKASGFEPSQPFGLRKGGNGNTASVHTHTSSSSCLRDDFDGQVHFIPAPRIGGCG